MVIENEYDGKVVLVTGAARGIGKAVARSYAQAGARVMLADKDQDTLEKAKKEIRASSVAFLADITSEKEIKDLLKETFSSLGRIDILINNAGISNHTRVENMDLENWDLVLNTNLRGAFLCSKEAAFYMKKNPVTGGNRGGSIVNIASTRAFMSEPGWEAYAASKGGLISLTHAMASSLAEDAIQVNCISPGWIETGNIGNLSEKDHRWHFSGRVGYPEDIANACLFLTSETNRFINGTNLVIDGGVTRKMVYP